MRMLTNIYIPLTITLGGLVVLLNLRHWDSGDLVTFLPFLLVTVLASGLKLHLPGVNGTMSAGFFFVLIAIVSFTSQEALVTGCTAVLVQCVWHSTKKLRVVQVLFNLASASIGIASTYEVLHYHWSAVSPRSPLMLVVFGCTYFVFNTFPVAGVIALTECKSLWKIWRDCYLWSFPYYLLGAAAAGLFEVGKVSALVFAVPVAYVIYRSYRLEIARLQEVYGNS